MSCQNPNNRKRLLGLLCATLVFFSGCNESYADNPVVQSLQQGNGFVDLSRTKMDTYFEEFGAVPRESLLEEQLQQENLDLFHNYVETIQQADDLRYQRIFTFSEDPPEPQSPVEAFSIKEGLVISERKGDFVATDFQEEFRIAKLGDTSYYIDLKNKESTPLESLHDGIYLESSLLSKLCNDTPLTLLSVDEESASPELQPAYNVSEGTRSAKWFFDFEGNLSMRIWREGDRTVGVRYDFFELEPEDLHPDLFTLEGIETLPSMGGPLEEDPEEESSKEESDQEESSKEESSQPTSLEESAPSEPSSVAESQPESKEESVSSASLPEESLTEDSKEESQEESKDPHVVPDLSKKQEEEKQPESTTPEISIHYPHDIFPLIYGFQATSTSDEIDALQRSIRVSGTYPGNLASASTYYGNRLKNSSDFSQREMYDDTSGYTYIIYTGTKDGWRFNIEIRESHRTSQVSISFHLTR